MTGLGIVTLKYDVNKRMNISICFSSAMTHCTDRGIPLRIEVNCDTIISSDWILLPRSVGMLFICLPVVELAGCVEQYNSH